eukprot:m.264233 g.264233  ORF g.264233 m.264233 type:complete len:331 (-) comp54703_c0_seq1:368-1360(-)
MKKFPAFVVMSVLVTFLVVMNGVDHNTKHRAAVNHVREDRDDAALDSATKHAHGKAKTNVPISVVTAQQITTTIPSIIVKPTQPQTEPPITSGALVHVNNTCFTEQAKTRSPQCIMNYSPKYNVAMFCLPKAASSTMKDMFVASFPDRVEKHCNSIAKDAHLIAFVRDPVERFLSGYEEAIYRRIQAQGSKHGFQKQNAVKGMPEILVKDINGYTDWLVYWNKSKSAFDVFEEYVHKVHDSHRPYDIHLNLQSSFLAQKQQWNFIGRIEHLNEDWNTMLSKFNLKFAKEVPQSRKNHWKHLKTKDLSKKTIEKICEHVATDLPCVPSKWC